MPLPMNAISLSFFFSFSFPFHFLSFPSFPPRSCLQGEGRDGMSGDAADTQGLSTRDQWRLITRLQEQNALLEQEVAALRAQKARWLQGSGSGGGSSGLGGSTRTLRTGGPGSPRNMLAAPPDIPPITAPKTTATVAVQTDKELVCQTTFFSLSPSPKK